MGVTIVSDRWQGIGGGKDASGDKRTRVLDVVATPEADTDVITQIRNHASVPKYGSVHPTVGGLFATNVDIRENGGPVVFLVTVQYAPKLEASDPDDPLAAPAIVSWGSADSQEAIDKDEDGNQIGSSAGEPFDPPLTRPTSDLMLNFQKNYAVATVTPAWLQGWSYRTNTNQYPPSGTPVIAAGEALILGIPAATYVPAQAGVVAYYQVAFRIGLRVGQGAAAWKRVLLDQGYRIIDGSGNLVTVCDAAQRPLNQPVLLNGSGGKLATGGTPVLRTFRIYKAADFTPIGLVLP